MAVVDKVFAGSIPRLYDRLMVPLIFETYAGETAERIATFAPMAVLETAAGSGAVTRALAPLLNADARYVVTDLNQPMLDHAAARQGLDARIEWRVADALDLPFAAASFDLVCCQFGAMFFPDRVAGYAEARRVLKPGGHFVCTVWDRLATNDFAAEITAALAGVFPEDPPRFLARTPHGYHDPGQIREDLERAGFGNIEIELCSGLSRGRSARDVAVAYCEGTPLCNEILSRDPARLAAAVDRAAAAIVSRHGEGEVVGRTQALRIVASAQGRVPGPSRPGF